MGLWNTECSLWDPCSCEGRDVRWLQQVEATVFTHPALSSQTCRALASKEASSALLLQLAFQNCASSGAEKLNP